MYDYRTAVLNDVKEWIGDNEYYITGYETREDLEEYLNEVLWTDDSVTGNGSGSYTFSSYEAGVNLAGNFDLLREALEEFGGSMDVLKDGEEACDVTIRCYLLGESISQALDELEESGFFEDDEE